MKIVVAPDSFKGSCTAKKAAESIKEGILRVCKTADVVCVPMADGGEGTVQSLVDATGGRLINARVMGPLMEEVEACYGILGDGKTAVIEMAAASGIMLVPRESRNPMKTTTYGTGELIRHAMDSGCRNIIIGIGGSATNDGGAGMAQALGIRLLDVYGNDVGFGGGSLTRLHTIDMSHMDERIKQCTFTAACDVDNPMCGPKGATYVYGPQKGASEEMLENLDAALDRYAELIKAATGTAVKDIPGAGAAGGLGGGLLAFLGAVLRKGIDMVIETVKLEELITGADLVITGEGRIDYQTQFGKTPYGVARLAKKYNVPVIALAGYIGDGANILYDKGIDSMFSIIDRPMTVEEAMADADTLLQSASERIMRLYNIFN